MNQKGFGLIMIVITVAIIAAAVGGSIYYGKNSTKRSMIEVGIDATDQAQDVKVMLEQRQKMLQQAASSSAELEARYEI